MIESVPPRPRPIEATSDDPARLAIKLVKTPGAINGLFRAVASGCLGQDHELMEVALYLLARVRLNEFKRNLTLPKNGFDRALDNASILAALDFVKDVDRETYRKAYKGFEQWFDRPCIDFEKEVAILQVEEPTVYDKTLFRLALDVLLLPPKQTFNNDLPETERLPILVPDDFSVETDAVVQELHKLCRTVFGCDCHYIQIMILAECIALMKRFERNKWQVQTQDVVTAWRYCTCFVAWEYPMHKEVRKLYTSILAANNANKIFSQWDAIKAGINRKYVAQELRKDTGQGIASGIVEKLNPKGYWLTERGKRLILNDFTLEVDGRIIKAVEDFEE
jgi:hypothetical protein